MHALIVLVLAAFIPTLHEGDTVPAIPLVNQSGHAFSLQSLRGNALIVSFIYTRCRDARMCPLVAAKFARMQAAIGAEPIRLVALTLDPANDTPSVLRRYGAAYRQDRSRWILATGAPASLDDLATRFGIATERTQPGQVVHSEAAAVLDGSGRVVRVVEGNAWTPSDLLGIAREANGGESPLGMARRARLWLTSALARCGGGSASFSGLGMLAILGTTFAGIGVAFARALHLPPR